MGTRGYADVITDGRWNGKTVLVESELDKPLHWKKPRTIFVCSMSDLFHRAVPFEWIDRVYAVMALCPQHRFLVLTKRPHRMAEYHSLIKGGFSKGIAAKHHMPDFQWPLPNVWHGVTVCNQQEADEKIPMLLEVPSVKRFVSIEPMLGPVDIGMSIATCDCCPRWSSRLVKLNQFVRTDLPSLIPQEERMYAKPGIYRAHSNKHGALSVQTEKGLLGIKPAEFTCLPKLDYVIAGGESGPGARPTHPDWVRSIRDQCQAAGVGFHFKQWGSNLLPEAIAAGANPHAHNGGNVLDGQTWEESVG